MLAVDPVIAVSQQKNAHFCNDVDGFDDENDACLIFIFEWLLHFPNIFIATIPILEISLGQFRGPHFDSIGQFRGPPFDSIHQSSPIKI
jgi:hypothetical protein